MDSFRILEVIGFIGVTLMVIRVERKLDALTEALFPRAPWQRSPSVQALGPVCMRCRLPCDATELDAHGNCPTCVIDKRGES